MKVLNYYFDLKKKQHEQIKKKNHNESWTENVEK